MPSTYEFFLLDDFGKRITSLRGWYFFSYSKSTRGLGVLEIGFPLDEIKRQVYPFFQVDRRIDVWRSPETGIPMKREEVYLMRKYIITTRDDNMDMITFYCRDAKDFLNRRFVIQAAGTSYARKTAAVDDMMKEIVREQMLYGYAKDVDGVLSPSRYFPNGEFVVQENLTLGPVVTQSFADRKVMDVLKDLLSLSSKRADENPADNKIYFDVVPFDIKGRSSGDYILDESDPTIDIVDETGVPFVGETASLISASDGIGFRFETFAGLRGIDRTSGITFSKKNNNLKSPTYSEDHLDEATSAVVKGFGRGDSREWDIVDAKGVTDSRWNRVEVFEDASAEPDQTNLADYAYDPLNKNKAQMELNCTFLNIPESKDTPRSLYGVDWDLGDLVPVEYAGISRNVEISIVYVAVDEKSQENITGRNDVTDALN